LNLAEQIVSRLPQLRRFARALTGSQGSGDAYVGATLEAIAEDPALLSDDADMTINLFQVFCHLWRTIDVNAESDGPQQTWTANADQRLAAMVPQERLVFLLCQLEGFSMAQAAQILRTGVADIETMMREANAEIAQQLASRVLIIEDEPLISLDLTRLVNSLGHEVCAVARTHGEALAAIAKDRPGLILADLQLADGSSGADAVNDIMKRYVLPVIFITAHPQLLLTGERPEPTYLIAKPYDSEEVKAMVSQVLFFQTGVVDQAVA
jgi:CheY-like chemotaxis protein/DNA-directed RNA polymerase specialized sigma24 family protein